MYTNAHAYGCINILQTGAEEQTDTDTDRHRHTHTHTHTHMHVCMDVFVCVCKAGQHVHSIHALFHGHLCRITCDPK